VKRSASILLEHMKTTLPAIMRAASSIDLLVLFIVSSVIFPATIALEDTPGRDWSPYFLYDQLGQEHISDDIDVRIEGLSEDDGDGSDSSSVLPVTAIILAVIVVMVVIIVTFAMGRGGGRYRVLEGMGISRKSLLVGDLLSSTVLSFIVGMSQVLFASSIAIIFSGPFVAVLLVGSASLLAVLSLISASALAVIAITLVIKRVRKEGEGPPEPVRTS